MKTAVNPSDTVKYWRPAEHSSFDFVQAVCGFVGLVGVRYRSLCFQRFSFQHFSISALPSAPPISRPPIEWLFQGLPAESKLLPDGDGVAHPLKLEFGNPSSTRSEMRFTVFLRREAAANGTR
jgi:hypothetical protein